MTYSVFCSHREKHAIKTGGLLMDKKELKKMLAGVGIAGLISGVSIAGMPGTASSASG